MRHRVRLTSILATTALAAGVLAAVVLPDRSVAAATPSYDFANPETVASGLTVPWGMDFLPDGSALVAERNSGRVLRVRPGQAPQQVTTIAGVSASGESGLLGLAVSPTFAQDDLIYVYFTTATDNRIARLRLSAPATQTPILTGLARATIHDGGRIAFGPDRMLYAGVGDASVSGNAQNMSSRNGKILRMRPDGGVPADNPFPGSLVYSLGHRNPQGLAWDAQGRLFAVEFGQNTWDEVNLIVPGGNYGWPTVEGMANDARFRNPVVQWTTAEASPSGAAISGDTLYVAALRGTRLWTVPLTGNGGAGTPTAVLQGRFGRLRTAVRAPDGTLWVTTSNRDGRGTPAATDDRILRFRQAGTPPTTPPTTTTPPPTTGGCTATYQVVQQWTDGFEGGVTVRNTATTGSASWTVTWTFGNGQAITNLWNGTATQNGASVTVRNADWNGSVPSNGTTSFGFTASLASAANTVPAVSCTRT